MSQQVTSLWYDGPRAEARARGIIHAGAAPWMGGFVSLNESREDAERHRDLLVEKHDLNPEDFHFVRLHLAPWSGT